MAVVELYATGIVLSSRGSFWYDLTPVIINSSRMKDGQVKAEYIATFCVHNQTVAVVDY